MHAGKRRQLELVQSHAHGHIRVLHHLCKLLEADLAVAVQIGLHDGLVDDLLTWSAWLDTMALGDEAYLLQLLVLEIAADHHLQHDEELAIADVAVAVDVIYPECKPQLLLLVSLAAEGRQPRHEFLEVDIAASVLVKYGNHARRKGIRGDLGKGEELVAFDCAGVVLELGQLRAYRRSVVERRRTLSSFINRFLKRSTSSLSTGHGVSLDFSPRKMRPPYSLSLRLCCRSVGTAGCPLWRLCVEEVKGSVESVEGVGKEYIDY